MIKHLHSTGTSSVLSVTLGFLSSLASSPAGATVAISTAATENMTCSAGLCAPTGKQAVLNAGDLENLLASGDVEVTTTGSGVQAGSIRVIAPVSWSSTSMLSLVARRVIEVDQGVSVTGSGGMSFAYKTGGYLLFGSKGSVDFSNISSLLKISGREYTLVNSISALSSAIAAKPKGAYALANSYDASQDGTYPNSPVSTPLQGAFDGLGNTISNLSVDNPGGRDGAGLFVQLTDTGIIANVRLKNETIKVEQNSETTAGGLVDVNRGLLFDDQAQGSVSETHCCSMGGESAGGLVGVNESDGSVIYGTANVHVRTHYLGGGLVADNAGTITLSHATGKIAAGGGGGLAGHNEGIISKSYATGSVTIGDSAIAGGLVGLSQDSADIVNSYSTGAATGGANSKVGGLIGENDSTIEDSYSTGAVSAGTGSYLGGFAGLGAGFTNCYWDVDTSGTDQGTGDGNVDGLSGLTTGQLQAGLPSGFDPAIWAENSSINAGFPYLIAIRPKK